MAEASAQASEDAAASGVADDSARAAISEEEVSALLEKNAADSVVPFDLSARRISRTQLPMLEFLCRNFAERVAASLTRLVSREVTMQFDTLQSGKTADLQAALPFPGSLAVIRIKPLPGLAFVSVDPSLLLVLLDVFFGGQGRATSDPQAAAARRLDHGRRAIMIGRDHGGTIGCDQIAEQPELGGKIMGNIEVVIHVVARQVGEAAGADPHPVQSILVEPVR